MKLHELLSDTNLEGYIKIQCWENEDNPTVYYEGYNPSYKDIRIFTNRRIAYIFPYTMGINEACLCIELEEE